MPAVKARTPRLSRRCEPQRVAVMAKVVLGILIPSTTLAITATRWGSQRRDSRGVRAFTAGMAPLTLGLLLATGYVLTEPSRHSAGALALVAITVLAVGRFNVSPIWMV